MSSTKFTPEELAAFREEFCKGASDSQFELFISEAIARNRPATAIARGALDNFVMNSSSNAASADMRRLLWRP